MMGFEYPYLWWLIFLPFAVRYFLPAAKTNTGRALRVPFLKDLKNIQNNKSFFSSAKGETKFSYNRLGLWLLYVCVVLSLMRPVEVSKPVRLENEGRDILLVTDISTSMLEDDFVYQGRRLERMEAVRAVISDFASKRVNDKLGLILFGTRAYEQVPLTFDKKALLDVLSMMQAGMAGQSTSIGDAVALALKSLRESKTAVDKQVIILLTDGENNDGNISFPQAIKLAKDEKIKVYTIGIGAGEESLIQSLFNIKNSGLDEENLKKLAEETKGRYFKADSLSELIKVYHEIDKLEKESYEENFEYLKKELYYLPLLAAFLMGLILVLANVLLSRRRR